MPDAASVIPHLISSLETATSTGWRYLIRIRRQHATQVHTLTLSWVDHDYWSGGAVSPSATIDQVIHAMIAAQVPLPARADCSTLRRLHPGLDQAMLGIHARAGRRGAPQAA